jgi:hypothetical protein
MVWLSVVWLCAMSAYGQRGANFGHSDRGMFPVPRLGAPDLPPSPPPAPRGPAHRGASPASLPYFPLLPGGWDYDYAPYAPPPNVTIVQPPPPPVIVQERPPQPLHSEIREYKVAPESTATVAEPPSFAIALRDGSVHFAMAVTAQDGALLYVDSDGRHERIPLETVDRETTTRLNRERNLTLRLPPQAK